jgi:type VI secretion system secreted protein Hcp
VAAVDYFLIIDGIKGESQDAKMKPLGAIDVASWSWGEAQAGTMAFGGGGGAGKATFQDFHFTMKVNRASPELMLACAEGRHIKKAVLIVRKAGGGQQEYMKITMTDLMVSSFQTGGSGHSDIVPTDQVGMNFAKIEFDYKEQQSNGTLGGSVKAGYDLKAGMKL